MCKNSTSSHTASSEIENKMPHQIDVAAVTLILKRKINKEIVHIRFKFDGIDQ